MAMDEVTRDEMEQLQNEVGDLRNLFEDLNARHGSTADAVEMQEGILRESYRAELVQRDELISSIEQALGRQSQAIAALAARTQDIEHNDHPMMASLLRRLEILESESSLRATAGGTTTTPPDLSDFYATLQRTMDQMEEMKTQLTERGNVCEGLEERQVEMTNLLNDLKFEIDDVQPKRQAEIEVRFEKITTDFQDQLEEMDRKLKSQHVEFHETLLEQLTGVNEMANGMEHRIRSWETF